MITNLTIGASSIRKRFFDSVNDNVSLTLNWDEPFANFDPIVNYTVTISCTYTSSCPVILNVTTTSVGVNFISDYTPTMSTPLSVTASNSIGTSDPTTIVTASELLYLVHACVHVYVCTYIRRYCACICNFCVSNEYVHCMYIHSWSS